MHKAQWTDEVVLWCDGILKRLPLVLRVSMCYVGGDADIAVMEGYHLHLHRF